MTLVKTLQPPTVVYPENPVLFGFNSSDIFAQAGVAAEFVLLFPGWPVVGATFDLNFNNATITFEFISGTSNIPEELTVPKGLGFLYTKFQMLQFFRDEFLKHYLISKYYDVIVEGAHPNFYLTFKAKQPGAAYTMTLGNPPGFLSTDPAYNVDGVDAILHSFFGTFLQCYINDELAGEDLLAPNPQGNILYDVSAYLKAYAAPSFIWPPKAHIEKRPGLLKKFYVRYAERYGIPAKVYKLQSTAGFSSYSLPGGGAGFMLNSKYEAYNESFWETLKYKKQFLTWQPKHKHLKMDQIENLFFLMYQPTPATQVINLNCSLDFFDAVPATVTLHSLTVSYLDVLEISFTLNDILEQYTGSGTRLHRVALSLLNQADAAVSETRWYYSDPLPEIISRQFIWRNSFGMYDTDLFTGKKHQTSNIDKQVFSLLNSYTYQTNNAPTQVLRANEVEQFEASTGWIDDTERMNWLRDMFLSREVYEIIGRDLYPVVITSADIKLREEGKTLHNIHFTYTRAYTDEHFSKPEGYITTKFKTSFQQQFVPQTNPQ